MKSIIVCGTFNENGGKPSGYMRRLFGGDGVTSMYMSVHNGGTLDRLGQLFDSLNHFNVVYWFPNVSNDVDKYLPRIKAEHPKCILISSKRNDSISVALNREYSHKDLISRMLSAKSNLLLELTHVDDWRIWGTVHDPLGNIFVSSGNIEDVRNALFKRVSQLYNFKRVATKSIGEAISVPDQEEFFKHVRRYADKFHDLIHAVNQDRLLGNSSFRCESGFPSFKNGDMLFVSCRNIDKRHIEKENFVGVAPLIMGPVMPQRPIEYFGNIKPSVDAPVQVGLYWHYKNVKYMLHSHTYIQGAPYTKNIIPCGAIEEYSEILNVYPEIETHNVAINLLGHGSLIMASDLSMFNNIPYIARPMPEYLEE